MHLLSQKCAGRPPRHGSGSGRGTATSGQSTSPTQSNASGTPPPSLLLRQEIAISPPSVNVTPSSFRDLATVLAGLQGSTGKSVLWFSRVVPFLLKRKSDAYALLRSRGSWTICHLAMENGVVRAKGMGHPPPRPPVQIHKVVRRRNLPSEKTAGLAQRDQTSSLWLGSRRSISGGDASRPGNLIQVIHTCSVTSWEESERRDGLPLTCGGCRFKFVVE